MKHERRIHNPLYVNITPLPRKLADHGRAYLIHKVTQRLAEWCTAMRGQEQEYCHVQLVWDGSKRWHIQVWDHKEQGELPDTVEGRVCHWFCMMANEPDELPGLAYRMLCAAGVDVKRPEDIEYTAVKRFARVMRQRLEENRDKGGWQSKTSAQLLDQLEEAAEKLEEATQQRRWHDVTRKAADVANFAMSIADNFGKLE